jgi:hypothetical protein
MLDLLAETAHPALESLLRGGELPLMKKAKGGEDSNVWPISLVAVEIGDVADWDIGLMLFNGQQAYSEQKKLPLSVCLAGPAPTSFLGLLCVLQKDQRTRPSNH